MWRTLPQILKSVIFLPSWAIVLTIFLFASRVLSELSIPAWSFQWFLKIYFSSTVNIQYHISFRCTIWWLDIYIAYEVITWASPVPIRHLWIITLLLTIFPGLYFTFLWLLKNVYWVVCFLLYQNHLILLQIDNH